MGIYTNIIHDISIHNKYYFWWKSIIENASTRSTTREIATNLLGYVEGHHILPISFNLGGQKDVSNIVYLTAREHIIVHMLMCKFTTDQNRIRCLRAFHCMCVKNNGGYNQRRPTVRQLALARQYASEANKGAKKIPKEFPKWIRVDDRENFKETLMSYVENTLSDPEIAKIYNTSAASIHVWRRRYNIPNRRWQLRDKNWLYENYITNGYTCKYIGEIIGCTATAVQQYLLRFKIQARNSGFQKI